MSVRTEMVTCDGCGSEAEEECLLDLRTCPLCGQMSCKNCRHDCAHGGCHETGCENCMIKFEASPVETLWFCSDADYSDHVDPYGLARQANEARRNMAAACRQFLPVIEDVATFDIEDTQQRDYAVEGLRNASKIYLQPKGGL